MNEVEFRVWNKISKEFSFFDTLCFDLLYKEPLVCFKNFSANKVMITGYTEPMQYVGIKDQKNKKIFVKDFIEINEKIRFIPDLITAHYYIFKNILNKNCLVIGNEYENPEFNIYKNKKHWEYDL